MKKSTLFLLGLLALLLPFTALLLYYWIHRPLTLQLSLYLLLFVWWLVASWILVPLAGGLGLRLAPLPGLHPLARLSLQARQGRQAQSQPAGQRDQYPCSYQPPD